MLRVIVIIAAVLLIALALTVATRPDSFHIQRSASIKAPAERIFPLIADFHAWQGRRRLIEDLQPEPALADVHQARLPRAMDKMIGDQFDKGLSTLKAEAEMKSASPHLTLSLRERGPCEVARYLCGFPLPQGEGQGEGMPTPPSRSIFLPHS